MLTTEGVNRGEVGLLPLIIDLLLLLVEVTLVALALGPGLTLADLALEVEMIPVVGTPCLTFMTG